MRIRSFNKSRAYKSVFILHVICSEFSADHHSDKSAAVPRIHTNKIHKYITEPEFVNFYGD
jgi:hypothetical protein